MSELTAADHARIGKALVEMLTSRPAEWPIHIHVDLWDHKRILTFTRIKIGVPLPDPEVTMTFPRGVS